METTQTNTSNGNTQILRARAEALRNRTLASGRSFNEWRKAHTNADGTKKDNRIRIQRVEGADGRLDMKVYNQDLKMVLIHYGLVVAVKAVRVTEGALIYQAGSVFSQKTWGGKIARGTFRVLGFAFMVGAVFTQGY